MSRKNRELRARAKQNKPATTDPNKPTNRISSDEFTPDGTYIPLSTQLESYWDKPKCELPENLRELVSDSWDYCDLDLRKRQVWLYDYEHDPAKEEIRARNNKAWREFGYHSVAAREVGSVGDWHYWAIQKYITPREIACLMFTLDPKHSGYVGSDGRLPNIRALAGRIDEIERSATRDNEGKKLSPAEWIEWAQDKCYVLPREFIEAVAEVERKAEKQNPKSDTIAAGENAVQANFIIGGNFIPEERPQWAGKPTLVADEAIPLMNGVGPKSWRNRHDRTFSQQLPDEWVAAIERGLKIAEGEKVVCQSPADWLAWGKKHGLDQPILKSDGRLLEPDICMWPLFADAVAEVERRVQEEIERKANEEAEQAAQEEAQQNDYLVKYGANPTARIYPVWQARLEEIIKESQAINRKLNKKQAAKN